MSLNDAVHNALKAEQQEIDDIERALEELRRTHASDYRKAVSLARSQLLEAVDAMREMGAPVVSANSAVRDHPHLLMSHPEGWFLHGRKSDRKDSVLLDLQGDIWAHSGAFTFMRLRLLEELPIPEPEDSSALIKKYLFLVSKDTLYSDKLPPYMKSAPRPENYYAYVPNPMKSGEPWSICFGYIASYDWDYKWTGGGLLEFLIQSVLTAKHELT